MTRSLYLKANDSYTIHLKDGKRSVSSKHIRVFETNLVQKTFFRVHKSYIINLAHLKGFNRTETLYGRARFRGADRCRRRRLPISAG